MSTFVRLPNGKFRLFVKGAPDFLLSLCVSQLGVNGIVSLTSRDKVVGIILLLFCFVAIILSEQEMLQKKVIEAYGEQALRVILFAFRDFDSEEECHQEEDDAVQNLVLQMLVGIQVWVAAVAELFVRGLLRLGPASSRGQGGCAAVWRGGSGGADANGRQCGDGASHSH